MLAHITRGRDEEEERERMTRPKTFLKEGRRGRGQEGRGFLNEKPCG
jgi:hypothetical protein